MDLKILKIDDSIVGAMNNVTEAAYYFNKSNYGIIPFRMMERPLNSWAIAFVTGHKYKLHWQWGLDFMGMQIDLSPHWKTTDSNLNFVFNFTDVRAAVQVVTANAIVPNNTLMTKNASQL